MALAELSESGKVVPVIDRTYPLSETAAAIQRMVDGDARGKIVVTVPAEWPARFAALGDLHASENDQAYSLDTLLEMSERDETDRGQGDLPYPPEYPKMPGEPKRVQHSRGTGVPAERSSRRWSE